MGFGLQFIIYEANLRSAFGVYGRHKQERQRLGKSGRALKECQGHRVPVRMRSK